MQERVGNYSQEFSVCLIYKFPFLHVIIKSMTDSELKTLKDNLWHAADVLRAGAHLAANKYGQPILGLIFLRYADILYKQHKAEIQAEYDKSKGTRAEKSIKETSIKKCGFYLPEEAYYTTINPTFKTTRLSSKKQWKP